MNHSTTANSTETTGRRLRRGAVGVAALAMLLGACSTGASTVETSSDGGSATSSSTSEPGSSHRSSSPADRKSELPARNDSGDAKGRFQLHRPNQNPNPMVQPSSDWSSMSEFLWFVIEDADHYWTSVLTGAGLPEPQVQVLLPMPGVVERTACSPTDDRSMYYCPSDDTIVFSQQLAIDLWNGHYTGPDGQTIDVAGGDMAPALMVAHEFAHSIQSELGLTTAKYTVPRIEKHADCWAGVWARNAGERGLLDEGDVQEAVNTAFLVGDSQVDHPQHHGTSAQRIAAFQTGFNTTTPADCDVFLTS